MEESPPRQRGSLEIGGPVPSLAPPQPGNSGRFLLWASTCPALLVKWVGGGLSAEVRPKRVGSRVRGLCPQGPHHHCGSWPGPRHIAVGERSPSPAGRGRPPWSLSAWILGRGYGVGRALGRTGLEAPVYRPW